MSIKPTGKNDTPIHIALIEDEEIGRKYLRHLLETQFPDCHIVGEADSLESGLELLQSCDIDLLFLDIHLGDGDGFYLLSQLAERNFDVVFVTAYKEYALQAFEYAALQYLLKPVSRDALAESLERYRKQRMRLNLADLQKAQYFLEQQQLDAERLVIAGKNEMYFVRMQELIRCEANGNYTNFYLEDGQVLLSSKALKFYEDILPKHRFVRIHNQHIINLQAVQKYIRKGQHQLELKLGHIVDISVRKRELVQRLLGLTE